MPKDWEAFQVIFHISSSFLIFISGAAMTSLWSGDEENFFDNEVRRFTESNPSDKKSGSVQKGILSVFTGVADLTAEGANNLRRYLNLNKNPLEASSKLTALHDLRFVILDNDSKLLFSLTFENSFEQLILDAKDKTPMMMDLLFADVKGWPGIKSPTVKAFLKALEAPTAGWYVANTSHTIEEMNCNRNIVSSIIDAIGLSKMRE